MSSNFRLLKEIVIEMRGLALNKLDTMPEFEKLSETEKELHIYSLFNHGLLSQSDFLKNIYGIKVEDLEQINEQ